MSISAPIRVAMWSGPRNLSTALMRSWSTRHDTIVTDEPLYACYLSRTGIEHPGKAEIVASQETDWRKVAKRLTGPIPDGKPVWYQKHMAHHLLPEMERDWLDHLRNGLLIRNPARVLASYARVREMATLADIGLVQQFEIAELVERRTGNIPPIVDADDLLREPEAILRHLTEAFGLDYSDAMLRWPAGPRPTDGIWAGYWYGNVENSTGFAAPSTHPAKFPDDLAELHEECLPYYRKLHERRLGQ